MAPKLLTFPYQELSLEERLEISTKIRQKYPSYLPILVSMKGRDLKKKKYLVPEDVVIGKLIYSIREENQLSSYESLFLFAGDDANSSLVMISHTALQVYSKYRSKDGFLYITVAVENTFG